MSEPMPAILIEDEPDRVRRHRFERFLKIGFAEPDAEFLAESDADLHEAEALKRQGCPLELIERILT